MLTTFNDISMETHMKVYFFAKSTLNWMLFTSCMSLLKAIPATNQCDDLKTDCWNIIIGRLNCSCKNIGYTRKHSHKKMQAVTAKTLNDFSSCHWHPRWYSSVILGRRAHAYSCLDLYPVDSGSSASSSELAIVTFNFVLQTSTFSSYGFQPPADHCSSQFELASVTNSWWHMQV